MNLFSNDRKIEPISYWTSQAKNKKKLIVFYGEEVFDLTNFASKHPAGEKAITPYLLQDVKNILFRIYPHPDSTVDVLRKYKCGKIKDYKKNCDQQEHKGICKDKSNIATKKQQPSKKVSFDINRQSVQRNQQVTKELVVRGRQKEGSMKMEENLINFEQNKPILMVPYFNTRIDCFNKEKQPIKQGVAGVEGGH